ncbi:amidase [Rhodococcus chondri]|uniref:amidase n=1 Tax=Rhodococcus chondri TaxID=3065941 RepID=A0ABU7JUK1_9NOCA|nr:amidase [Rhodococcus sp. CC-R104]MEE2033535.1 amidase [Rhodococcus sp. CC-R104]
MGKASTRPQGLAETAAALDAGTTTSAELVRTALDAIEASASTLNAFRVIRRDAAVAEAAEADRRRAAGVRLPLLGVPIAVKDDTHLAGEPTAFGCAGDFPLQERDAEVVRRLRTAGAVIVGKTHSPELGQWPLTGGSAFGHTRNPWSREHTPGGSSGGSGAAVAAGLVPAALGSDGAGSVRIPAAWSHLVGIKPQRGRISMWPDPEAFHGLTTHGTLARTVTDAALLLDAVSGNHTGDLHRCAPLRASESVGADPGRLRIALALKVPFTTTSARLHPQVRARILAVAAVLRTLGHEVTVADPDYGILFGLNFLPRSMAGIHDWLHRLPDPALADARTRANAQTGRLLRGLPLRAARAAEPRLRRRVGRIFDRFDVVLAPTTATPPVLVDAIDDMGGWATDKTITAACPYAWPWNVLGWPGINVPAGFTEDGLPVGAQLLGHECSEPLLISLAAQLESEMKWHEHVPARWW